MKRDPVEQRYSKVYKKSRRQTEHNNSVQRQVDEERRERKRRHSNEQAYELGSSSPKRDPVYQARPMCLILYELKRTNDSRVVYSDIISQGRYYLTQQKSGDATAVALDYLGKRSHCRLWDWQEECIKRIEERERDDAKIGSRSLMLCYDMGLGKGLITLNHLLRDNQNCYRQTGRRYNGTTLIACPNKLLAENWVGEVTSKWPIGSFQYYRLYSAKNRLINRIYIENCCDFVIVTYATIKAAYKYKLQHCGDTYNENDEEEESDEDNEEDDEEEEEEGQQKEEAPHYYLPVSDERSYKSDILYNIQWKRIVADESHHFVNKNTRLYKAMLALKSTIKWVVTGTPIQNKLLDICSNFNFIGVALPLDLSYAQLNKEFILSVEEKEKIKETLKVVMIRKLKSQVSTIIPLNEGDLDLPIFMPVIKTIKLIEFESLQEKLVYYLYATYGSSSPLFDATVRSKKTSVASILQLMIQLCVGMRIVNDLVLPHGLLTMGQETLLKLRETPFKESLFESSPTYQKNDNTLESFASRLNKRTLFGYKNSSSNASTVLNLPDGYRVAYHASLESPVVTSLDNLNEKATRFVWDPFKKDPHFDLSLDSDKERYRALYERLCHETAKSVVAQERDSASSKKEAKKSKAMVKHLLARTLRPIHHSTKNRHIIKYIQEIPAEDSVIVFSNSITGLECLAHDLSLCGIESVVVSGRTPRENSERMAQFMTPGTRIKVLLLSFKLGNVGLNIIKANHILFVHPWWNPNMIAQAENRIQRLGQTKPVYIVHFIINGTIDLYVHNRAHDKRDMTTELIDEVEAQLILPQSSEEQNLIAQYEHNLYEYTISQ
jgi:SNF2 family DNA or RNA helicase